MSMGIGHPLDARLVEAVRAVAAEASADRYRWGDPPRVFVGDFGYAAVSVLAIERDIAVNIPSTAAIVASGVLGVPVAAGRDGTTELIVAGQGTLELICTDAAGRLVDPAALPIRNRRQHTAAEARQAWLASDLNTAAWATARLAALPVATPRYGRRQVELPNLVGDRKAAATAGLAQDDWDRHAAFVQAHLSHERRFYWHALTRLNDTGVVPSPEAMLLFAGPSQGPASIEQLSCQYDLPTAAVEAGLRELNELGLAEWPPSLEAALDAAPIDELRAAFGPHGIKGQSRATIVGRALELLGADAVRRAAEEMHVDLNRPVPTDRGSAVQMTYGAPDARSERLAALERRPPEFTPPAGLPDDFGREHEYSSTIGGVADNADPRGDREDDQAAEGSERVAELDALMGELIDLAGDLLQRAVPPTEVVAVVQAGAMTLIDMLGELAQRLTGRENSAEDE